MKNLYEYIMEAGEPKGFLTAAKRLKLYQSLLIDDRERIQDINSITAGSNNIPSFEDIEQLFLKNPDYKERVDDYFEYVTRWLKEIKTTPEDIVKAYSLSRSGKQMKIEVIATVVRGLISF